MVVSQRCKSAITSITSRITNIEKKKKKKHTHTGARIMVNKPRRSCSKEKFASINLLSFKTRCIYFAILMVHKTINDLTPPNISSLLNLSGNQFYKLISETNDKLSQ